jgi:hypothetical protein
MWTTGMVTSLGMKFPSAICKAARKRNSEI